jgi:hypothetical protein
VSPHFFSTTSRSSITRSMSIVWRYSFYCSIQFSNSNQSINQSNHTFDTKMSRIRCSRD